MQSVNWQQEDELNLDYFAHSATNLSGGYYRSLFCVLLRRKKILFASFLFHETLKKCRLSPTTCVLFLLITVIWAVSAPATYSRYNWVVRGQPCIGQLRSRMPVLWGFSCTYSSCPSRAIFSQLSSVFLQTYAGFLFFSLPRGVTTRTVGESSRNWRFYGPWDRRSSNGCLNITLLPVHR
jgi:hypothetical protein